MPWETRPFDGAVERLIKERLGQLFPGMPFSARKAAARWASEPWVIDPIDGTAAIRRRLQPFSVSIALVAASEIEVGVIYNPLSNELFAAERGRGASCNGRTMRVSEVTDPARRDDRDRLGGALRHDWYLTVLRRVTAAGASMGRSGAGRASLAHVADGRLEAAAEIHINSWTCWPASSWSGRPAAGPTTSSQ